MTAERDGCSCVEDYGVILPEERLIRCAHFGQRTIAFIYQSGWFCVQREDTGDVDTENILWHGTSEIEGQAAFDACELRLLEANP